MILKDILAISGEGGLFRFIAQGKNSIIVEHLETKKRLAAHGTAKVSSLEDISIFTETEDVPLSEVFNKIYDKENGGAAIDHKSSGAELTLYFEEVLPEFDKERVYTSDIKKLLSWYNILQKLDLLKREDPAEEEKDKEAESNEAEKVDKAVKDNGNKADSDKE